MIRWRDAWHTALYATDGFFRREAPVEHFRTSANASPAFAAAMWQLIQNEQHSTVVDMGAGRGEFLIALDQMSQGRLRLIGVDVVDRPAGLPDRIEWQRHLPERIDGLLIANEWLDNVPCDVVERGDDGTVFYCLVDPSTGLESRGRRCDDSWVAEWWPLTEAGMRAEIGTTRDQAWADAVSRVNGTAIAIDYGHRKDDRPPYGSLRSYRGGKEVDVLPDGSRDVTASVAVDAVARATGATLIRQRDALAALGVDGRRPPLDLATRDPRGYLASLAAATARAELLASGGWGDFWWIRVDRHGSVPD